MTQEIDEFVRLVGAFATVVIICFFSVAKFARGQSWATSFNFGIGTFTAFVPQGLSALVTILLSLAAGTIENKTY